MDDGSRRVKEGGQSKGNSHHFRRWSDHLALRIRHQHVRYRATCNGYGIVLQSSKNQNDRGCVASVVSSFSAGALRALVAGVDVPHALVGHALAVGCAAKGRVVFRFLRAAAGLRGRRLFLSVDPFLYRARRTSHPVVHRFCGVFRGVDARRSEVGPPAVHRLFREEEEGEQGTNASERNHEVGLHCVVVQPRSPGFRAGFDMLRVVPVSVEVHVHTNVSRCQDEKSDDERDAQGDASRVLSHVNDGEHRPQAGGCAGHEHADSHQADVVGPVLLAGLGLCLVVRATINSILHEHADNHGHPENLLQERDYHTVPDHEDDHATRQHAPVTVTGEERCDLPAHEHDHEQLAEEQREHHAGTALKDAADLRNEREDHERDGRAADHGVERRNGERGECGGIIPQHGHDDHAVQHGEAGEEANEPRGDVRDVHRVAEDVADGAAHSIRAARNRVADGAKDAGGIVVVGHVASSWDVDAGDGKMLEPVLRRLERLVELVAHRGAKVRATFFEACRVLNGWRALKFLRNFREGFQCFCRRTHEPTAATLEDPGNAVHGHDVVFIHEVVSQPVGDGAGNGIFVLVGENECRDKLRNALFRVFPAANPDTDQLPNGERVLIAGHSESLLGEGTVKFGYERGKKQPRIAKFFEYLGQVIVTEKCQEVKLSPGLFAIFLL